MVELNGFSNEREIVDISSVRKSLTFDRKLDVHISNVLRFLTKK